MKIGDEVYIHGYVDEIRNDTIIIRNDGGYFGTVASEIEPEKPGFGETTCMNPENMHDRTTDGARMMENEREERSSGEETEMRVV